MNVQPLSRLLPLFLVIVAVCLLAAVSHRAASHSALARYQECTALAVTEPAKALAMAKAWRVKNTLSPSARHCEALALFGLKNYAGAGEELLLLSNESSAQDPALSLKILLQAAEAYTSAGSYDIALKILSDRLALPGNTLLPEYRVTLLTSRAELYKASNQPLLAIQDLDQALILQPDNAAAKALLTEISAKIPAASTGGVLPQKK